MAIILPFFRKKSLGACILGSLYLIKIPLKGETIGFRYAPLFGEHSTVVLSHYRSCIWPFHQVGFSLISQVSGVVYISIMNDIYLYVFRHPFLVRSYL